MGSDPGLIPDLTPRADTRCTLPRTLGVPCTARLQALGLLAVRVPCHVEDPVTSKRFVLFSCACIASAMTVWPAEAVAQRTSVHVGAGVGYYRPSYYRPYYYGPYYHPYAFSFYAGWYPFHAPYPFYGPYPYPAYYGVTPWASARLEVKPRHAQVYVDGYYVGIVDQFDGVFQRLDLPTGEHELAIYLPGHRTYTQRTLFRPSTGYHFKAILEPLPAGSPDEPAPKPSPDAARTPLREMDPYQGDPRDPRDPREARDPRDPRRPERTVPLPEREGDRPGAQERGFGTLNLRVQPSDAVVMIDGERWDSPEGGSRLVVQLLGGSHRIEVRKEGFRTYTSAFQIRAGETQTLNISLTPGGGYSPSREVSSFVIRHSPFVICHSSFALRPEAGTRTLRPPPAS